MYRGGDEGLRVLYVGTLPPHPGGSAILAADVLSGLAGLGHRVRAVAPIVPEAVPDGDSFALAHPEIEVARITVPYFENSPDMAASEDYRGREGEQIGDAMRALIACERPDVVIIGRESFICHASDVALAHGIPSLLMIQGTTAFGILRGTIPEAMARELFARFRRVDLLVSVARHLAKTLESLGLGPIEVIENTVDEHVFTPRPKQAELLRELRIGEGDVVVAHVSNLKALKRPLDLVAAAREALPHDPRLVFVVVGDGNLRAETEAAARREGVAARFRFTGWVEHARMPDYINLADVVVMPSEAEARALVYLEAQACGRVLLASDIASAREVVVDGETGLLFAKGDVADLAAKLLRAAGDEDLRAEIGRRAREAALARSLGDLVRAYDAALRRVVR
jgi:glycosyltransferase involved in cell wall biosynthesis